MGHTIDCIHVFAWDLLYLLFYIPNSNSTLRTHKYSMIIIIVNITWPKTLLRPDQLIRRVKDNALIGFYNFVHSKGFIVKITADNSVRSTISIWSLLESSNSKGVSSPKDERACNSVLNHQKFYQYTNVYTESNMVPLTPISQAFRFHDLVIMPWVVVSCFYQSTLCHDKSIGEIEII